MKEIEKEKISIIDKFSDVIIYKTNSGKLQ